MNFPLFTSRSYIFSSWRHCRHSWCVFRCRSSSVLVFHLNSHRIWRSYEIFIWCECYFTCQWVNRIRPNFCALFYSVNRCFFYYITIHHEFGWLVRIDLQRNFRITFGKLRRPRLNFSLFTSRCHVFSRWRNRRNRWRILRRRSSSVLVFDLNSHRIWRSNKIFIRCEGYFTC